MRGLLHRIVVVHRPVEVTIEYFARSLFDRILVDGRTAVSVLPIMRLTERFDFKIPYQAGHLPASPPRTTAPTADRAGFHAFVLFLAVQVR